MLFLIEPPAKRVRVPPVRSGQHLLDLTNADEDDERIFEDFDQHTRSLELSNVRII